MGADENRVERRSPAALDLDPSPLPFAAIAAPVGPQASFFANGAKGNGGFTGRIQAQVQALGPQEAMEIKMGLPRWAAGFHSFAPRWIPPGSLDDLRANLEMAGLNAGTQSP